MANYQTIRKRVDAVRWNGANLGEVERYAGSSHMLRTKRKPGDNDDIALEYFDIITKEWFFVPSGSWIVRFEDSHVELYSEEAFSQTFQPLPMTRDEEDGTAFPPNVALRREITTPVTTVPVEASQAPEEIIGERP